jgi:16S rRNA (adenine1518-N6/adenine1519-N6)-dimethyltransferase
LLDYLETAVIGRRSSVLSINMVYAKKSYGQHFLNQPAILQRIADVILKHDEKNFLEIGPGRGALTEYLIKGNRNFKAVEADRDMQEYLTMHAILTDEQLIREDVLKIDFNQLFDGESFLLCGNFPYNISSQILIKTLLHADRIPVMIGMFQKEVVMRIISPPGSKEYGTLSVMTQLMYTAKKSFDINPAAFTPAPKVMSSVLELKRKQDYLSLEEFKEVQKLVRTAFQFRRKTLRNNLKTMISNEDFLADPYFNKRPEELSPLEFLKLKNEIPRESMEL